MRITILTVGSMGDIQPYLALAVRFKKNGHKVRFVTNSNFSNLVIQAGLEFFPINVDSYKLAQSSQAQSWLESDSIFSLMSNTKQVVRPVLSQILSDIPKACHGSDLIIYHSFTLPFMYYLGKHLKIPSIPASIYPLPTRAHPALPFNISHSLSKNFNLLTHQLVDQFSWHVFFPVVKKTWKEIKEISIFSPYRRILEERSLILCGYSPTVLPPPHDFPAQAIVTGYWFLDSDSKWTPSPELIRFINSGKPPIYVGFGSMGNPSNIQSTVNIVLKTLTETGQRAVFATGWSGFKFGQPCPENVFLIESIPLEWLFPQMSAIVHHGGAGTTGLALKAGIPNVIVPHFSDNYFWGNRVAELGAGPTPIPRKKLTAEKLAESISLAISSQAIRKKAAELGLKIKQENGVDLAMQAVLKYISQREKS